MYTAPASKVCRAKLGVALSPRPQSPGEPRLRETLFQNHGPSTITFSEINFQSRVIKAS